MTKISFLTYNSICQGHIVMRQREKKRREDFNVKVIADLLSVQSKTFLAEGCLLICLLFIYGKF